MRRASLAIQQLETSTRGTSKAMLGLHIGMAAMTAAAVTATQTATAFGKAMAEVHTLIPKTKDLDKLTRSVRNLSREFGTAKLQQAKALYQIISAGATDAAKAHYILRQSNILAVGGVTDIATAADGLTSILNAYGPAAVNAATATDAMFVAMRVGKTTIDELSRAVGLVSPLAAEAGVSLESLLSAASALTSGGIRTRLAFTGLRQIIASIVKPTTEARYAAEQLGIEFNAFALYEQGLEGFFDTLKESTGGSIDALAQLFGGVEALVPILALTGRQSEQFKNNLEAMTKKAGEAEQAMEILGASAAQSFARFRETATDVLIDFGKNLLTVIVPALEAMTKQLRDADIAMAALGQGIKDAAKWLGIFAGAFGVGALKGMTTKLGLILSLWKKNRKAIKLFGVAAVISGTSLRTVFGGALKFVLRLFGPWGIAIGVAAGLIGIFTKRAFDASKQTKELRDSVDDYVNSLAEIDYTNLEDAQALLRHDKEIWATKTMILKDNIERYKKIIDQAELDKGLFKPEGLDPFLDKTEWENAVQDFHNLQNRLIAETTALKEADEAARIAAVANLASAKTALLEADQMGLEAAAQLDARRQIQRMEDARREEEIARKKQRLQEQLQDKIDSISASSVDNQLRDLERLLIAWKIGFQGILPDIQEEFDRLEADIDVRGVVSEIQRQVNKLGQIDLSRVNINIIAEYDIMIEKLREQLELAEDQSTAQRIILDELQKIEATQAAVAAQDVFAFPTRNLDIQLRELRQNITDGIVNPEDWAIGAKVAIEAFFSGIEEAMSAADMEKYGHEIKSALEDLSLGDKIQFPGFVFDEALANARIQFDKGFITQETFDKMEQNAKDAFNSMVQDLIDIINDPTLQATLGNMLKLDKIDSKNFRKIALEVERAGRAALQILSAFGAINDETAEMLEAVIQIGANLAGAFAGDLNSIAQVVAGAAQIVSTLLTESEGEKRRREALENNTKALQQVAQGIADLSNLQTIAGGDISNTIKAFKYNLEKTLTIGDQSDFASNWKSLEYSLGKFGLSLEDAQAIVEAMGGTWEKGRKNFRAIIELLESVTLRDVFNDAASSMDLLQRKIELFKIEPLEALDLLRKQFLDLVELDPATELALAMADINTDVGRQQIYELLRGIFENFPDLTFEELGKLSPQEFLDFIQSLSSATDAAQDFAEDINGINDSLKNIPEGFKVALARFEALDPIGRNISRPPTPPIQPPTGVEPFVPGGGRRGGTSVVIEEGAIQINGVTDPEEIAEVVLEALKDNSQLLYGDTSEWARL